MDDTISHRLLTIGKDQYFTWNQWLKLVSNLPRISHLLAIPVSPPLSAAALIAELADLVKDAVYRANVEHVTISLEYA